MNIGGILSLIAELEMAAMEWGAASEEAVRLEKEGATGLKMQFAKERFDRAWERLEAARIAVYGKPVDLAIKELQKNEAAA